MAKKRSIGVIIFAIVVIIIGLYLIYHNKHFLHYKESGFYIFDKGRFFSFLLGFPMLLSGIFILMLRSWARKLCIFSSMILLLKGIWLTKNVFYYVFFSVDGPGRYHGLSKVTWETMFWIGVPSIIIGIALPISIIYFFNRQKVKELFKK